MKLDMGEAWNAATAMIAANRDVLLILAGVFFFLPNLAITLLIPQSTEEALTAQAEADPMAAMEAMAGVYGDIWWALLLITIMGGIGMLAVFVLLTDKARPTVGEALKRGVIGLIPYLLSQFLAVLAVMVVVGALVGTAVAIGANALIAILSLAGLVIGLYIMVKFSLSAAVIGIEGVLNPVKVLRRSWQLTQGNSVRIFFFFFLLLVAVIVVSLLVSLVLSVIFAAIGGEAERFGNAAVAGLLNAVLAVVFYSVLAAIHRQLAGPSTDAVSETFS